MTADGNPVLAATWRGLPARLFGTVPTKVILAVAARLGNVIYWLGRLVAAVFVLFLVSSIEV
jgi:hypothetical protein